MENSKLLLSIIIPVFNGEKFLCPCLDNILSAEIDSFEIILVNDGSTDGSGEICRRYADKYAFIRVFNLPNSGPSAARNLGIDMARGEFIIFFDADDYIDPKAFRKTVSLLSLYDAQVWISDFYRVSANGCVLDRVFQIRQTEAPISDKAYMPSFLSDGERVWNVWRYIFRREFLLANDLRFIEGVNCAEDLEFIIRVLTKVERPIFFHNPYYYYRAHYGDTLTTQSTLPRISQLMEMLRRSMVYLSRIPTIEGDLLRGKVIKEFLLNIPICCEIKKEDRAAAFEACGDFLPLMAKWGSKKDKIIAKILTFTGLPAPAYGELGLKKIKRAVRKNKIKKFDKRICG